MGMSTYVKLLRDKDDPTYKKMLKIFLACREADTELPPVVEKYFGEDGIDAEPEAPLEIEFEAREWSDSDGREGIEIDLDELPPGVKTIRFINSW